MTDCVFENNVSCSEGNPWCVTHKQVAIACMKQVTYESKYLKEFNTATVDTVKMTISVLNSWMRFAEQCGIAGDQIPFETVAQKCKKYDQVCAVLTEIESFCKGDFSSAESKGDMCNHILDSIAKVPKD